MQTIMSTKTKISIIAWILSAIYLVFICFPISMLIYVSVMLVCGIIDLKRFLNKTIKNAKTKSQSKFTERVS